MTEQQTIPSREDVENLKASWAKDGCWDIEETEGFEAYREELLAFAREKGAQRQAERDQKVAQYAGKHGVSIESANLMMSLEDLAYDNTSSAVRSFRKFFQRAGVSPDSDELENLVEDIARVASAQAQIETLKRLKM